MFQRYIVENLCQGDPSAFTLKDACREEPKLLLNRTGERRCFEVPLSVAEYDKMGNLDLPG